MAKIIANGKEIEVQVHCRLVDWLAQTGWKPTQVVVELNGEVIPRGQVEKVELRDSDCLEVIMPVAGG